jgi:hypothetical protein
MTWILLDCFILAAQASLDEAWQIFDSRQIFSPKQQVEGGFGKLDITVSKGSWSTR